MIWTDNKDVYQAIARKHHPAAKVMDKDNWFCILIACLATPFVGYRKWMENYAFAFGPLQFYHQQLNSIREGTIVHECGHTRQCEILGWVTGVLLVALGLYIRVYLHPWLGIIPAVAAGYLFNPYGERTTRTWAGLSLFIALYFLVPFFVGLAVFKCWFELDADRARWRWMLNHSYSANDVMAKALRASDSVNGRGYFYALPVIGPWWFKRAAEAVVEEHR